MTSKVSDKSRADFNEAELIDELKGRTRILSHSELSLKVSMAREVLIND